MSTKNYALIEDYLINFIKTSIKKTNIKNAILGISGGIDSAIVATLAKKALGNNFYGALIPSTNGHSTSLEDGILMCKHLDVKYEIINISDLINLYSTKHKIKDKIRIGNFIARVRMAVLYDCSAKHKAVVLGTSNKSELMLGYGTIYGDLAYAINPISSLYKTEIFEFASYLNVPEKIIQKPPSADLWEGQSDEEELGFSYKEIDPVLHDISEFCLSEDGLKAKYNEHLVDMILLRRKKNAFKHNPPVFADFDEKLSKFEFLFRRKINNKENQ